MSQAADAMDYLHVTHHTGEMDGMASEAAGILSLCARGGGAFVETDCDALWRAELALRAASKHGEEAA